MSQIATPHTHSSGFPLPMEYILNFLISGWQGPSWSDPCFLTASPRLQPAALLRSGMSHPPNGSGFRPDVGSSVRTSLQTTPLHPVLRGYPDFSYLSQQVLRLDLLWAHSCLTPTPSLAVILPLPSCMVFLSSVTIRNDPVCLCVFCKNSNSTRKRGFRVLSVSTFLTTWSCAQPVITMSLPRNYAELVSTLEWHPQIGIVQVVAGAGGLVYFIRLAK